MELRQHGSGDWDVLEYNTQISGLSTDPEGGIISTLGPFLVIPTVMGDSGGLIEKRRKSLMEPMVRIFELKIEGNIKIPIGLEKERVELGKVQIPISKEDVLSGKITVASLRIQVSKEGVVETRIGVPERLQGKTKILVGIKAKRKGVIVVGD